MSIPLRALVLVVSLCPALALQAAPERPVDVDATLAYVLPDKADRAWQKVPWRATLWDAVIEAHEAKKPILLWAMNGHALACT